ncbi:MAG: hypothetical protein R3207_08280, partial [Oceanospirillum sp.]|nr:hypothetical protein [Oceanospirillum sp.]
MVFRVDVVFLRLISLSRDGAGLPMAVCLWCILQVRNRFYAMAYLKLLRITLQKGFNPVLFMAG